MSKDNERRYIFSSVLKGSLDGDKIKAVKAEAALK